MSGRHATDNRQPAGYANYLPPGYQSWGPDQDPDLDRLLINGDASVGEASCEFYVTTPDVKCRTRITLALIPAPGTGLDVFADPFTDMVSNPGQLWLAMLMRSRAGAIARSPVRNLVGTRTTPQAIPTDPGLWGFDFELETVGQDVRGVLSQEWEADEVAGQWRCQVRYNSLERMSAEEWAQLVGRGGLRATPVFVGGGG